MYYETKQCNVCRRFFDVTLIFGTFTSDRRNTCNECRKNYAPYGKKLEEPKVIVTDKPLIAWRIWFVTGQNHLHSIVMNSDFWEPKDIYEANIVNLPLKEQSHGIYCYKDLKSRFFCEHYIHCNKTQTNLHEYIIGYNVDVVIGEIYIWGRIANHKEGYRAQFAKIKSLYASNDECREGLSSNYKIPVGRIEKRNYILIKNKVHLIKSLQDCFKTYDTLTKDKYFSLENDVVYENILYR